MIIQRERAFEVSLANVAHETILVVTLQMLVQQILPGERLLAEGAREFIRVHVERVVPGQIVHSCVLLGANVACEHGPLRVAPLVISEIAFLGERLLARATYHLIRLVLLHVHVIGQLVAVAERLLAKFAHVPLRLFALLYIVEERRVCHDFIKESVL